VSKVTKEGREGARQFRELIGSPLTPSYHSHDLRHTHLDIYEGILPYVQSVFWYSILSIASLIIFRGYTFFMVICSGRDYRFWDVDKAIVLAVSYLDDT
jgi:short subunit fatty acids transporter